MSVHHKRHIHLLIHLYLLASPPTGMVVVGEGRVDNVENKNTDTEKNMIVTAAVARLETPEM